MISVLIWRPFYTLLIQGKDGRNKYSRRKEKHCRKETACRPLLPPSTHSTPTSLVPTTIWHCHMEGGREEEKTDERWKKTGLIVTLAGKNGQGGVVLFCSTDLLQWKHWLAGEEGRKGDTKRLLRYHSKNTGHVGKRHHKCIKLWTIMAAEVCLRKNIQSCMSGSLWRLSLLWVMA